MERVDVAGLRIAYQRTGAGPTVLLVHGGLADHREWTLQQELVDAFTLVAWDAPGCGESDDPPEQFRMADYADTLAAFVETIRVERPAVVGLSFGATLALELAHRHPTVPRALVLAGAYAGWAGSLERDEVDRRLASMLSALDGPRDELVRSFVETLLTGDAPHDVVEMVSAMTAEFRTAPTRTLVHAMAECDLRDALPSISVPTFLVHGELDVRAPLRAAEEIRGAIPGAQLVVVPGAGHQVNIEGPAAFTGHVRSFLESLA